MTRRKRYFERMHPYKANHPKRILREMCRRVGAVYDRINFKEPNWFTYYTWTEKERESFFLWLLKYLRKREAFKSVARIGMRSTLENRKKIALHFIAQFGWSVKEHDSPEPTHNPLDPTI